MKKHRGLVIAIIIIAILIVLAISAFAVIYIFTDIFKTDKQLFAKYATSMVQEKTAFFPEILKEYTTKKQTTPYENNGSFTANITSENSSTLVTTADPTSQINSMLNYANNTRINFSGKVDKANNRTEQSINIFYTNDISLPFNYKQVGDIYALQSDFVLPNYIGIENNNIPELLQKLGISVNSIEMPSKIEVQELQSLELSEEEIMHLYNKYLTPIVTNLADEKFSKKENSDGSKDYILTLTSEDLKNILIKELETLSQDTAVINKINSIYQEMFSKTSSIVTKENIEDIIANLQETDVANGDLIITISQINGKINKIDFNIISTSETSLDETEVNITITKNETSSNITYNFEVTIQNSETEISGGFEASYTNINTNSVVENYSVTANLNNMSNVEYNFSNNVVFANTVGITDFDLNNTIILNNYPENEVQIFLNQLMPIIAQKNEEQMQEIGYPIELVNPIYMWFMGPGLSLYIYNMTSDTIGSADLENQATAVYNQEFLQYEGTVTGVQARTLVNTIEAHNNSYADEPSKQIQITSEDYGNNGVLEAPTVSIGQTIAPALISTNQYKVTFAYDPTTGYITACGITNVTN